MKLLTKITIALIFFTLSLVLDIKTNIFTFSALSETLTLVLLIYKQLAQTVCTWLLIITYHIQKLQ